MNPIKKIVSGLLILLVLCIYSSCLDDEINGCVPDNDYATSIDLTITLPEPTKKITRAADDSYRMDFTDLSNVNVVLYPKDTLSNYPIIRYYDNNNIPGKFPVVNGNNLTITVEYNKSFGEVSEIYLVGNYDQQLDSTKFQHPSDLKSLKIGNISESNFLPECVFFGKAKFKEDLIYNEGKRKVSVYTAALSRPIAMVSINLEDHGLHPTVSIRPTEISIHNIPINCRLDSTNVGNSTNIIKAEGKKYSFYTDWGILNNQNRYVGSKNLKNEYEGGQVFYVYENVQQPYPNTSQSEKDLEHRPNATYIKIYADYIKINESDPSKVDLAGTISYRFCLGEDVIKDYSVKRNIHYDITLELKDYGGAGEDGHLDSGGNIVKGEAEEEGWRVDLVLKDRGFDVSSIQLNAGAATGTINVLDGGSRSEAVANFWEYGKLGAKTEDWLFIYINGNWEPIDDDNLQKAIDNKKIEYYVKPLRADASGLFPEKDKPYRQYELTMKADDNNRDIVTIRQWLPIKLPDASGDLEGPLYMDRFENINTLVEWGYNNNDLSAAITSPRPEFKNNFLFGDNDDGLSNTFYLRWGTEQSEIASNILEKTGYDKTTGGLPALNVNQTAMYYIPNSKELKRVMDYVGIINIEDKNRHDPVDKNVDYWSSSVLNEDKLSTLYWDGISKTIKSTTDRNSKKRVRYVYRPSKDLN